MGTGILIFTAAFLVMSALFWSGFHLFQDQENPLRDRLDELQAKALVASARGERRKAGGGFLNRFLYLLSLIPGLDDYLQDTERELAQAGIRNKQALGRFVLGHVLFMLVMLG